MSPATKSPAPRSDLIDRVREVCRVAASIAADREAVASIEARLDEPLRVAIAGRVKTGKSTLLNALVGERLAATDAGECTRVVTWYRHGASYSVRAVLRDGSDEELPFNRRDGVLDINLGSRHAEEIEWLEVRWPASRLTRITLVDTPGLESLDEARSQRTKVLLGIEEEGHSRVDAVVYLMRHLHRSDTEFLEAFLDRSLARPSPVNAVAVLSRADEIGAGRLDALRSASAIAGRYAEDRRVRLLCATVLPVAGLIAETGATLREEEVAHLRALTAMAATDLDEMLLSVERFCAPGHSPLTAEFRRDLLLRLGLFGVRFCIRELQAHPETNATQLAQKLVDTSGIGQLIDVLDRHLGARAAVLKARSALIALRALAGEIGSQDRPGSERLRAAIERLETGAHELSELRLLHLLLSGAVDIPQEGREEVARLTAGGDPADRLGMTADAGLDAERAEVLRRLEAWRTRASHPLTDRTAADACEIIAQSYERLYAELSQPPN